VERKISFDETTVPIEEKESFKWLESLRKVKRLFSKATTQVVTVCDREADIYEFFADASKQKMPVLIRASFDRSINKKNRRSKPEDKLWGFIKSKSCAGVLKVEVAKKKGEPARVALLAVRFSPFILNPPTSRTANKDGLLPNIDCHAIYVSEVNPPQDATPLEWMLISSIPINNFEEATEKITWYCYRWRIENFHKILKSGYHIEACRLQTASRLIRFVTLMSIIAWRLHWLTLVARSEPDLPCTTILTESEWHVLFTRQNRTKEIPKQPPTLRTVIRWVAQLGGFFGRKSDGEPGSMAIWRGWKRLIDLAMGWELASK
jgi:hypothetical protein